MVMSLSLRQGIVTLSESADKNVRYLMDLSDGAVHDFMRRGERGYIVSDEGCTTDTEGVFVAGDCRTKSIRQISTATADGAVAALAAVKYIGGQPRLWER